MSATVQEPVQGDQHAHDAINYPPAINMGLFGLLMFVAMGAWHYGYWPVTLLCWFGMAHLGHTVLLAFHEAVHYTLSPVYWFNEFRGFFIGASVGVPLSVYRHLHKYHHANLSSEKDAELWPYNSPKVPRVLRVLSALVEMTFGFFYTPLIFLRGVATDAKLPRDVARRVLIEYVLCVALWGTVLAVVAVYGLWTYFLVGYLIPSMLAGNMQTFRKFVEHMGLVGDTPLTLTRTVVAEGTFFDRLISASMLHVNYHGTHHRYGKLAYHELPAATIKAYQTEENPVPIFPSYWRAFWTMFPTLADPKCGPAWLEGGPRKKKKANKAAARDAVPPPPPSDKPTADPCVSEDERNEFEFAEGS